MQSKDVVFHCVFPLRLKRENSYPPILTPTSSPAKQEGRTILPLPEKRLRKAVFKQFIIFNLPCIIYRMVTVIKNSSIFIYIVIFFFCGGRAERRGCEVAWMAAAALSRTNSLPRARAFSCEMRYCSNVPRVRRHTHNAYTEL